MTLVRPKVHNIKLSLSVAHFPEAIKNISEIPNNPKYSWILENVCTASFILRNEKSVVYQVFKKGHINITGVKRSEDIDDAISYIYSLIGIPRLLHSVHNIDNIQGMFFNVTATCNVQVWCS